MQELTLNGEKRTETGKNAAGRLRRAGWLPANLIVEAKSFPIRISQSDFNHLMGPGLRQTTIIRLTVDGQEHKVIVKELQRYPVTGEPIHVDLLQVTPGKKMPVRVAIETTGVAKGVREGGALEHFIRDLRVKATPETFVDVLRVDATNMGMGESVYVKDLPIPDSWEVLLKGNPIVLSVAKSRLALAAKEQEEGAAEKGAEAEAASQTK